MKEKIINLRNEGKSYSEIQKILNCSKGTISYYCGIGQKEKTTNRTKTLRNNIIIRRLETFRNQKYKVWKIDECLRRFQKYDNGKINKDISPTFNWKDVLNKFGENTHCYLSGEKINLYEDNFYSFDHIIPKSKGGKNTLDNLGITTKQVNTMKSDLTPDELIKWCIKILEFNNYNVEKKEE